jgi:hypothetical protein
LSLLFLSLVPAQGSKREQETKVIFADAGQAGLSNLRGLAQRTDSKDTQLYIGLSSDLGFGVLERKLNLGKAIIDDTVL